MDDTKKAVIYELGLLHEIRGHTTEAMDCFKQIYQIDISYRDVSAKVEKGYQAGS